MGSRYGYAGSTRRPAADRGEEREHVEWDRGRDRRHRGEWSTGHPGRLPRLLDTEKTDTSLAVGVGAVYRPRSERQVRVLATGSASVDATVRYGASLIPAIRAGPH